jgi:2-methylcitrate dehydratase PrpD
MSSLSISRQFARWTAGLRYEDLPPAVVQKVKALLLHALTGAGVGRGVAAAQDVVRLALAEESRPDGASLFDRPARLTRVGAAFANAELVHASNLFDSYRMLTHPGPVLVPAAFANAELEGRSGKDLIVALAAGYELVCRLAHDFIPSTAARGFRPSPIYATPAAALVSGKLMGLDEDQLLAAVAIAANFASGLNEGPRTGGNELLVHEPQAARNGVFAALLARAGHVQGAEQTLEGEAGFYNAFTGSCQGELRYSFEGEARADLGAITCGLGSEYRMLDVIYRIYPCAGYNQGPIELMRQLRAAHGLRPEAIEEVQVAMNWIETLYPSPAFPRFPDWQTPRAGESTHYFVAHAAVHGGFPVAGAPAVAPGGGSLTQDAKVLEFMRRVKLVPQQLRPMFSPAIRIVMKDGAVHEGEHPYARMVWSFEQLAERLQDAAVGYPGGHAGFDRLADVVRGAERWPSVGPALAQLHAGA